MPNMSFRRSILVLLTIIFNLQQLVRPTPIDNINLRISSPHETHFRRGQCLGKCPIPIPYPNQAKCERAIRPGQPPRDKALFYTSIPGRNLRMDVYIYSQVWGLTNVFLGPNVWKRGSFPDIGMYQGTFEQERRFVANFNRVFASRASGRVYLMTPAGGELREQSIFWQTEWPAIRDSGLVTEIVRLDLGRVDDTTYDPTRERTLWWRGGNHNPSRNVP